jgi:hypothetical protein
VTDLPQAIYHPWIKGFYEVSPNLKSLGADFGNGELDQKVFQIDREWGRYHESKRAAVKEASRKYIGRDSFSPALDLAVRDFILERLSGEWPELFDRAGDSLRIQSRPGGEAFGLDELCLLFQEDLAVVAKAGERDWVAYIHVCNPSHWAPMDKLGLSFFDAHAPVPGFQRINLAASALVEAMIHKGPFVRFVWGLESDGRLNHHPVAPTGEDQELWYGRHFERDLFARVERQVIWPLPEVDAALFFIRPFTYHVSEVMQDGHSWSMLTCAVRKMSPEAKRYKGIPDWLFESESA